MELHWALLIGLVTFILLYYFFTFVQASLFATPLSVMGMNGQATDRTFCWQQWDYAERDLYNAAVDTVEQNPVGAKDEQQKVLKQALMRRAMAGIYMVRAYEKDRKTIQALEQSRLAKTNEIETFIQCSKELQIEMDEITSEAKTYEPASFSENLFPEANHYIAILQQQKSLERKERHEAQDRQRQADLEADPEALAADQARRAAKQAAAVPARTDQQRAADELKKKETHEAQMKIDAEQAQEAKKERQRQALIRVEEEQARAASAKRDRVLHQQHGKTSMTKPSAFAPSPAPIVKPSNLSSDSTNTTACEEDNDSDENQLLTSAFGATGKPRSRKAH